MAANIIGIIKKNLDIIKEGKFDCLYNLYTSATHPELTKFLLKANINPLLDNEMTKTPTLFAKGNNQLDQINIPENIQVISKSSFEECVNLTSIIIPNSVKNIGFKSFAGCISLKDVNLSEGLEIIDANAFYKCQSLKTIVFPSTLMKLSIGVFSQCPALKEIKYNGTVTQFQSILMNPDLKSGKKVICTDGETEY